MSKVFSKVDGFVGVDGVPVLLAVGDEYDASHPLAQARPEMFTEPKRAPGRPVGSRNKPAGSDD